MHHDNAPSHHREDHSHHRESLLLFDEQLLSSQLATYDHPKRLLLLSLESQYLLLFGIGLLLYLFPTQLMALVERLVDATKVDAVKFAFVLVDLLRHWQAYVDIQNHMAAN